MKKRLNRLFRRLPSQGTKSKAKENDRHIKSKSKKRQSFFRNVSIGGKYLAVFSILIVLFLLATIVVYVQLSRAEKDVANIIEKSDLADQMSQLALLIEQQDTIVSQYMTTGREAYIEDFQELSEQLSELTSELDKVFAGHEDNEFLLLHITNKINNVEDIFLNKIANENLLDNAVIMSHIELGTEKDAGVTLINRLIDNVNEMRTESIGNVTSSAAKSKQILVIANIVSILIALIILHVVSKIISNHLKKVVTVTTSIADGDLSIDQIDYDGRDEIGQITTAVNTLINNLRNMIQKVLDASRSVHRSSDVLTNSSYEVKLSGEQMVQTMEELASGSETQANSASDLLEKMQQFVESVQYSQAESQQIASSTEDVLTVTASGSHLMKQSVEQMEKIDNIVSQAVNKVRGLDEQSREISQLVEVVKDIADQTNLLALNAAIEAARAGEHGQGFAIVAEEVRKLAEEVTNSVTSITHIVENIQNETNEVVTSLDDGYREVQGGITQIEETGNNFAVIDQSISDMVDDIVQIAERLESIAKNSNEMNQLIEEIASISEEAAAGVEQSTAATQEISSSMDEVSQNAVELASLSGQLNSEVNAFTLK